VPVVPRRNDSARFQRAFLDLFQRARRDAGDRASWHTDRRCLRAPPRVPGGAQRHSDRALQAADQGVLIWALIWINVVGLGPFAGVLAIATADFGALGKLFAEIIESADSKEQEGGAPRGEGASPRCDSGSCRRCCPSLPGKSSISLNPTRARRRSSASSARAASGSIFQSRSGFWN